ncbi:PxKF domain-containing protein [Arthrobacter sp. UYCu723]
MLLLAVPLAPPASADEGRVDVGVILDSSELLEMINGGGAPATPVTFDVLAAGNASSVVASATSGDAFVPVSFVLADGEYKIRATAPGFLDGWFSATSGATGDSVLEMFGYQSRRDFASADVIVVDSSARGASTWTSTGWTVLHRSASSVSGAVANDASGQSGSLLEGVGVELHEAAALPGSAPVAGTTTDRNGYYSFDNPPPGDYKVRFSNGSAEKWWPETSHRAEAEVISLDGAKYYNLAYATFPSAAVPVDPQRTLTLTGAPATGATLTAVPDFVETGGLLADCLQRYTWFVDGNPVAGAFGPGFVVPLAAAGKQVTARLDIAGLGCAYTALLSEPIGPIDPRLTIAGPGVKVAPPDESGNVSATLTFDSVTASGTTSLTLLDIGDAQTPAPTGFSLQTDPPLIYEITTTAAFEGSVEVCFSVPAAGATGAERMYHHENGSWKDITTSYLGGLLCGVTDSFSPFAVGQPWWPFKGFLQPVENGSTLNTMKAGAAVPIKFSVGGDRGLGILAHGAPWSSAVSCGGSAGLGNIEQAVAAGGTSLSYHAGSAAYTYVWKTQKSWAGTCRQFILVLKDGSSHRALFDFRKAV